ncbi:hypothetical protein TA3x_005042 [Tundrisphaera sp. TA3]|uniref:hypothetical protein n=1 Tax=Tundrisphaera sp. TA3 TaxID=3435775 RepID=UPI003EBDFFCE
MIARLWWKEMRVIWPAWPILFGAGLALQLFLISTGAQAPILVAVPLFWPALYAFVVSAAAFAGERENGTLVLLDSLHVTRRPLWLGKASFALASTFALGLAMLPVGLLGQGGSQNVVRLAGIYGDFSSLFIEGVAWGLLWSALLRNPMIAGMMALASVGAVSSLATGRGEINFSPDESIPARLIAATVALLASRSIVTRGPRAEWSPAFLDEIDATGRASRPIRIRPANPSRALRWKAAREGRAMAIAWVAWSCYAWVWLIVLDGMRARPGALANPPLLIGVGLALVAGVGVFGGETAAGSQRFLLHLGVPPGRIWRRTARTWLIGLGAITLLPVAVFVLAALVLGSIHDGYVLVLSLLMMWVEPRDESTILLATSIAVVLNALAVGMLAGMLFRRRITAWLLAMVACVFIIPPQCVLAIDRMIPPWGLLLTPLALLAISRAWAADWLHERPGSGRWLRLLGYVAAPTMILPLVYVAHRAWGVPDPGPVATPAMAELDNPGQEAIGVYYQLSSDINEQFSSESAPIPGRPGVMSEKGDSRRRIMNVRGRSMNFAREAPGLIERIRRAAELPAYRPQQASATGTAFTPDNPLEWIMHVGHVLGSRAKSLSDHSDPADAWKDILAQYRIARQLTGAVPTARATSYALSIEQSATLLGLDWVARPGQNPELLRAALADLKALAPLPTLVQVIQAEAPILDRTFDLPSDVFERKNTEEQSRMGPDSILDPWLVYSFWERGRARRIVRTAFAGLIRGTDPQIIWMEFLRYVGRPEGRILGIHGATGGLVAFLGILPDGLGRVWQ